MKKIVFIHGANSTRRTFNYMIGQLPKHISVFFEYDTNMPLVHNIGLAQKLCDETQPDLIVGHSLGGVIACYVESAADRVALAAPFGGSMMANFFPMISQLMRDVATTSPVLNYFRKEFIGKALVIVAHGTNQAGHDGVLTVASQTKIHGSDVTFIHHNLNHYEVMVDDDVCKSIAMFADL